MNENTKYLITRIEERQTTTGKTVVDLYAGGKDSKLRYPVLTLFDLSELGTVGVDPNSLNGGEVHCRFWAYYQESDKVNKEGNHYKDVLYLKPVESVSSPSTSDTDVILHELRAVRAEIEAMRGLLDELAAAGGLNRATTSVVSSVSVGESGSGESEPEADTTATATDYWTLAHAMSVDATLKKRLAAQATTSGNWTAAIKQLRMAA